MTHRSLICWTHPKKEMYCLVCRERGGGGKTKICRELFYLSIWRKIHGITSMVVLRGGFINVTNVINTNAIMNLPLSDVAKGKKKNNKRNSVKQDSSFWASAFTSFQDCCDCSFVTISLFVVCISLLDTEQASQPLLYRRANVLPSTNYT